MTKMKTINPNKNVGVFVGRLCPIHNGHKETIDKMIRDNGIENCLIVLGSVGQKATFRVLFSYHQRKKWVRSLYGQEIRIVGMPDFPNDNNSWIDLLTDQIHASFCHMENYNIAFYGGSYNDLDVFSNYGFRVEVVDRTKMPVSATVIRDMALRGMSIRDFVPQEIHDDFTYKFARIMEENEKWDQPDF